MFTKFSTKFLAALVAIFSVMALTASPASAEGATRTEALIYNNDGASCFALIYAPRRHHTDTGADIMESFIEGCQTPSQVAIQARVQQFINGVWTNVLTAPRSPTTGYTTINSSGVLNSSLFYNKRCGTHRTRFSYNVDGRQGDIVTSPVSLFC